MFLPAQKSKIYCNILRQATLCQSLLASIAACCAVYRGKDGVNGGKLPFYYAGRTASDADTLYDQYFHTGITKRVGYSNPELDKLIEEQQRTADQKKRVGILQQAGRLIMEDAPFVPLYTLSEIYGVARNIVWKGTPDSRILAAEMKIKG